MTVDEFFEGREESKRLFDAIERQVARLGDVTVQVSKSQIAFRRKRNFAIVWVPGKYLDGRVAPLVLTISFSYRDPSNRWKQIVQAGPRRFTHHLEVFKASDIDAEVREWLRLARDAA
jgi:predicted transport protein